MDKRERTYAIPVWFLSDTKKMFTYVKGYVAVKATSFLNALIDTIENNPNYRENIGRTNKIGQFYFNPDPTARRRQNIVSNLEL